MTPVTQIAVPVHAATPEAVHRLMLRCRAEHADLVELRLDMCLADGGDPAAILPTIGHCPLPVLATNRHRDEGGAVEQDEASRLRWLMEADRQGAAFVDVELAHLAAWKERPQNARLVLSHHDFAGMGGDLTTIVERMFAAGAVVAKVAVTPADAADLDRLAELCARFGRYGTEQARGGLIALSMGEIGLPSRLLAGAWGVAMTFARLDGEGGSAPGQPTVRDLDKRYRVRSQGPETCIFGVIGDPVGGNLSPTMHNAAFVHHAIDAVSVPFLVHDAGAFWRACGDWIDGLSITIPHKAALMDRLDCVDDLARRIGVMDTVFRDEEGRAYGTNTDAPAGLTCVQQELGGTVAGKRVLLLGAGGVSRAIAFAFRGAGAAVTIVNRPQDRAEELAREVGCGVCDPEEAQAIAYDILINGTSVGMCLDGVDPDVSPWSGPHRAGSVVFDTVYTPLETRFLRDAIAAGARSICGLGMLERQAMDQYRLWTGLMPAQAILHRAALEALGTKWTEQVCRERRT